MSSTRSGINLSVIFVSLVNFILSKPKRQKHKTYDYTQFVCGRDYVFEAVDNGTKGYMTGQGKGIKRGDYIVLRNNANSEESYVYQVEEIDYYSEPSDMWMALLQRTTVE